MRNLTIGALIVCGGTIAALPFRRDSIDSPPGEPAPSLVTSLSSELAISNEAVPNDPWFVDPQSSQRTEELRRHASSSMSLVSQTPPRETVRGIPSDAKERPRRGLHLPLTYDDLAVPLSGTQFSDGRFDALANRQPAPQRSPATNVPGASRQYESMQVAVDNQSQATAARPPWEMASDLPQSILQESPSVSQSQPRVNHSSGASRATPSPAPPADAVLGRLASDSRPREQAVASEPAVVSEQASERQRHWIRQPD